MEQLRVDQSGEAGPGILGILALVILVGLIVGLGVVWYRHTHASSKIVTGNVQMVRSKTPPATQQVDTTTTSTAEESATGTTLIEMTGLKLELTIPNTIKDLIYQQATTSGSSPSGTGAVLSTQKLANLDANCGVTLPTTNKTVTAGLGDLVEYQGKFTSSNAPDKQAYFSKQFPTFYLVYDAPATACSTNPAAVKLAAAQLKAFESALSTVQLIP